MIPASNLARQAAQPVMKIGVMQPYLFPYLGYYQLMAAVDHFVVLDDVTFIKQGWINRNRIAVEGRAALFSVPLDGAGSHTKICDVLVSDRAYPHWRRKFFKTLGFNYGKARYFRDVVTLAEEALPPPGTARLRIRDMAIESLSAVMRYLGLPFAHSLSSDYAKPDDIKAADRLLQLCRSLGAQEYYNAPGGTELYSRETFRSAGVELRFLRPHETAYERGGAPFMSRLSVLDVLMFNPPKAARAMLAEYDLS